MERLVAPRAPAVDDTRADEGDTVTEEIHRG
jgi:hypothetical protein